MIIILKDKDTLQANEFNFKCVVGKNGVTSKKLEGDLKTPKGQYQFDTVYFRPDRVKRPVTKLKAIRINKGMGWCNDTRYQKKYNKLIKASTKIRHEKMFRSDKKYDLVIPIKYNYKKPKINKGSAIFIHVTKTYNPTAGCITLNYNDLSILLKLLNKKNIMQ